jgi:hypothetical protein
MNARVKLNEALVRDVAAECIRMGRSPECKVALPAAHCREPLLRFSRANLAVLSGDS